MARASLKSKFAKTCNTLARARVGYPLRAPQLILVTGVGLEHHYISIMILLKHFSIAVHYNYNYFIPKLLNYDFNCMQK